MFKIGNVEIKNNVFLAPMAGISNPAYIKICEELGLSYAITELISAEAISRGNDKTIDMLKGINDSLDNAKELVKLLKGKNVYVNLIPYNETNTLNFKKTDKDDILKFGKYLQESGIVVTIRREFGSKIQAACGQLRSKEVEG